MRIKLIVPSCLGDGDVAIKCYRAHAEVVFVHISEDSIIRRDHSTLKNPWITMNSYEGTYHSLSHRKSPKYANILLFVESFVLSCNNKSGFLVWFGFFLFERMVMPFANTRTTERTWRPLNRMRGTIEH